MGLEIDEEDGRELLIQPCRALHGTSCGIYEHRPECCRTFECKLLQEHKRGRIDLDTALDKVNEVRRLLTTNQTESAQSLIDREFLNL